MRHGLTCDMRNFLHGALCVLTMISASSGVQGRELDSEKTVSTEQARLSRDLPKMLVVRVKKGSTQAEVLHSNVILRADASVRKMLSTSSFVKLDRNGKMPGELDRNSSRSSWFFSYPYSYYPTYRYCGYNYVYSPCLTYAYGGYSYWYYSWPYAGGCCGGYAYGGCGYGGNGAGYGGGYGGGYGPGGPAGPGGPGSTPYGEGGAPGFGQ